MPKKIVDWIAIEAAYRSGVDSVASLSRRFNVSDVAIHKRAKKECWERDLTGEVRNKVRETLQRADAFQDATNEEVVKLAAQKAAEVVQDHRHLAARVRNIVLALADELEAATRDRHEIESSIEQATKDDDNDRRYNQMMKAVSLPSRASTATNLTLALKNVVHVERQAYSLDDNDAGTASYEDRLKRLANGEE